MIKMCERCKEKNRGVAVPSQLSEYSNLCTECTLALLVEHIFPRGIEWKPGDTTETPEPWIVDDHHPLSVITDMTRCEAIAMGRTNVVTICDALDEAMGRIAKLKTEAELWKWRVSGWACRCGHIGCPGEYQGSDSCPEASTPCSECWLENATDADWERVDKVMDKDAATEGDDD